MLDDVLRRLIGPLAEVPGVGAIVLGGSRARGVATASSDYDIGLYYDRACRLDTARLREVVAGLVDDPAAASVTTIGKWGPWIVGGGWLTVQRRKVDILYRSAADVERVIHDCRVGKVAMHYQPGHPHGFCSAIWMGEVALGRSLHDPHDLFAGLQALASPYPDRLREALVQKFLWEVRFSIDNGLIAVARGEQTHIVGCTYRALCCIAQVLFALNRRYLINEKGALDEAARLPLAVAELQTRTAALWQAIGQHAYGQAFDTLDALEREVSALAASTAKA